MAGGLSAFKGVIMPTNITFPTLPQNQPYCSVDDVRNLIGSVAPISDLSDDQIQSYIASATTSIETQTNNKFGTFRIRDRMDGNGSHSMTLKYSHVLWVNEALVYMRYPEPVDRKVHDFDLIVDRESGIITMPGIHYSPFFSLSGNWFYKGLRNVATDTWHGWSQSVFGEALTSTDGLTYDFVNDTAIKTTLVPGGNSNVVPVIGPVVYVDDVAQVNTTYTLVDGQWQADTDNIVYTLNVGANGYTGITFNTSQSGHSVTVDYDYWFIPLDINEACTKMAAVDLLVSSSLTGGFDDLGFQGVKEYAIDGARVIYADNGQFGNQMDRWNTDVQAILKRHTRIPFVFGSSSNGRY